MENMGDWEKNDLICELIQGKELAKELQLINTSSSSYENRELLLQKILTSYDKALSMLNLDGFTQRDQAPQPAGVVAAAELFDLPGSLSGSPRSEVSDQDQLNDVSKYRKSMPKWTKQIQVCAAGMGLGPLEDGYSWRKYGEKKILGAKYPRSYFRCTHRHDQGCLAKKHVQRSEEDPTLFDITYCERHICLQATSLNPSSTAILPEKQKPPETKDHYPQQSEEVMSGYYPSFTSSTTTSSSDYLEAWPFRKLDKKNDLQLEHKAELPEHPKAITSSDKKQKSDRSQMQLFPILDRQLFMEGLVFTEFSPDSEEWDKAEQIHLMDKGLSNLPKEPKCPKLTLLFLQRNYKLRKISTSFFINMPLLEFLDLSDTGIMSLPKSLFELSRLKELYVKDCKFLMVLPPEVGKLKRLEVLDMEGTEIVNLPVEIKELAVLRCLRVSLYGSVDQDWKSTQADELIPFGIISALSKLEDIYIYVNPDDERWGACVEGIFNEVCGLTRLRNLGFYFPRVELLSCLNWSGTSKMYQSLAMFRFIVGDHSKRIISNLPSSVEFELEKMGRHDRCLKYINGEGVPEDIKKVLQYAAMFHLDRHMTAKNLTEFGIENMEELQYCVLGECNEIQVIIDGNDVHSEDDNGEIVCESSRDRRIRGLESLQFLYVYNMKNLKSIWEGPVHKRCFSHLKSLTMSTCPQLTTIFTFGLLEKFHKLKEITIRDCPAIKSLVSCEEGVKHSANYLPQLRTISLHYVPELVSISSEVCIGPKLEELSLYNCPKLKSLSIKEVSSEHLREITGEKDWWEALEWTQVKRNQFDGIFVPINEDTCL